MDWFDGLVVSGEGSPEAVSYLSKFAWLLSQGEQLTENPCDFQGIVRKAGFTASCRCRAERPEDGRLRQV